MFYWSDKMALRSDLWYDSFRPDVGWLLTANRGGAVRYWNPDR